MVDRKVRDMMLKAIRSYMNEEITAFKLGDAIIDASSTIEDRTVQMIAQDLWFHYDDCMDRKIVAKKEEWDYFNRILLLLESDAEMETVRRCWKWRPIQMVAALLFLSFLLIAVRVGWGGHLIVFALPFGPPSILLAWFNLRRTKKFRARENALTPFPSISSMLAVHRHVSDFKRCLFPKAIADRRKLGSIIDKLMWVPMSLLWSMVSPLALFFQMLPERETETRIKMHESSAGMNELAPIIQT